jgi:hypothetical protein
MNDDRNFTVCAVEEIDPPTDAPPADSWMEVAAVAASDPSWRIRLRVATAAVNVGDTLRLGRAKHVGTLMPGPLDDGEHIYECDRLDGEAGSWETECDWSKETLANLAERIRHGYHEGDRDEIVELARRALAGIVEGSAEFELGPLPCDPRTTDHVMYQFGPIDAVGPLVVLVQMALAHSDTAMLSHVRESAARIPRMHGWVEACDLSASRLGQVEDVLAVVAANPGIKQTEIGPALDMDPALARSIGYMLHWAGRIGREKDGRTNRLYPA